MLLLLLSGYFRDIAQRIPHPAFSGFRVLVFLQPTGFLPCGNPTRRPRIPPGKVQQLKQPEQGLSRHLNTGIVYQTLPSSNRPGCRAAARVRCIIDRD